MYARARVSQGVLRVPVPARVSPAALPPAGAVPRRCGTREVGAGGVRAPPGSAPAQGRAGSGGAASPASLGGRQTRGGRGREVRVSPGGTELRSGVFTLTICSWGCIYFFSFPVGRWSRLISLPHPLFICVCCNCFPVVLSPSRRIADCRRGPRERRFKKQPQHQRRVLSAPLQEQE